MMHDDESTENEGGELDEQFAALGEDGDDEDEDEGLCTEEEEALLEVLENGDYGEEEVRDILFGIQQKERKPRTWAQGKKLRNDTKLQRGYRPSGPDRTRSVPPPPRCRDRATWRRTIGPR